MSDAPDLYGKTVRVTFGRHADRTGECVSKTYPKEPGRPQPLVMVKLTGGALVMVPVNDLEVAA